MHYLALLVSPQLLIFTINLNMFETCNASSNSFASSQQIQRLMGTDGQTWSDRFLISLGNQAKNIMSRVQLFPRRCRVSQEVQTSQWTQVAAALCPGRHLCPSQLSLLVLPKVPCVGSSFQLGGFAVVDIFALDLSPEEEPTGEDDTETSTLSEAGSECSQAKPGNLKPICRDGKMPWGKLCLRMGHQPGFPRSSSTILNCLAGNFATHLPALLCPPVSRDGR